MTSQPNSMRHKISFPKNELKENMRETPGEPKNIMNHKRNLPKNLNLPIQTIHKEV
jgi:hypothetical protein